MRPTRERLGVLGLAFAMFFFALAACAEAAVPKQILIVHSFGRDFAPYNPTGQAFRTRLTELLKQPVVFHEVSLDVERGELEDERPLVEYLLRRTQESPPDLIVAIANPAALFCLRHREQLFPDRSLLVTGVDQRRLAHLQLREGDGVVTVDLDFPAVARTILEIQPDTTTVALVLGSTRLERFWAEQIQRDLAFLGPQVEVVPLIGLGLDEIRTRVATLPPRAAVFYYMFAVDADGLHYESEQALAGIRETTNAPIFGSFSSQLGNGIVGGRLIDMAEFGRESAPMAVRMLAGEAGGRRHVATQPPTFDWRELERWNIPESRLPRGAVVLFRPSTLWEENRLLILVIGVTMLFQAALIISLLLQRVWRHRAEIESVGLRESEERVRQALDRSPVMLWTARPDSTLDYLNSTCAEFTGLPMEKLRDEGWLGAVHREDLDRCLGTYLPAFEARTPFVMEYRLRRADGVFRWVLDLGVPKHEPDGRYSGHVGCTLDITERKDAEDLTQELAGRLITVHEDERRHLARELHDDLTQRLARLAIDAGKLEQTGGEAGGNARGIRKDLVRLSEDVHALSYRLHPSILDDLGLVEALRAECDRVTQHGDLHVKVDAMNVPDQLTAETALCIYRIAQEALNNASRHGHASSVTVRLSPNDNGMQLVISDNGVGFDSRGTRPRASLGLASMRERVRLQRGHIDIDSTLGQGTTIVVWVPAGETTV